MSDPDRQGYIDGLRMLADALERNPGLALPTTGLDWLPLTWHFGFGTDPKSSMAAVRRGIPEAGWVKQVRNPDDPDLAKFEMAGTLAGLHLRLSAYRSAVCTRVVTGTREVTEDVPDPEALASVPVKTVTRVVEDFEWVCSPLLAPDEGGA